MNRLKVFVAGSTGLLGRNIVKSLNSRGHEVVALVRNKEKIATVEKFGGIPALISSADLFNPQKIKSVSKDCSVFINAISPLPLESFSKKQANSVTENRKLRIEGTNSLLKASKEVGAKVFLQQSLLWASRPASGKRFNEDSNPSPNGKFSDFGEAETIVSQVDSLNWMILRLGLLYASDSTVTRTLAQNITQGKIPIVGEGSNLVTLMHVTDAAEAFAIAAEELASDPFPSPRSGVYHLTDETPLPMKNLLRQLAKALKAPEPSPIPSWMAKMGASPDAIDFLTSSTDTSAAKFKQNFPNWKVQWKSFEENLSHLIQEWKNDNSFR